MIRIVDFHEKRGMLGGCRQGAWNYAAPAECPPERQDPSLSLDALVNIATRAGLNVRLVVKKAA